MTLGQLIEHDWMDYSLLAGKCIFFLWTNKTSAQHLLMIGCRVLHTHCGGHCIIENIVSKRQQQCVNLTNGRNKNTTTYCTKLPQHMPHTYYMSTTNGKMDQRRERVHDAKKHDGSSPILPNSFMGKCNGCSEKKKCLVQFQTRKTNLQAVCGLEVHMERHYHASALNFVSQVLKRCLVKEKQPRMLRLCVKGQGNEISTVKCERLITWRHAAASIQSARFSNNARTVA